MKKPAFSAYGTLLAGIVIGSGSVFLLPRAPGGQVGSVKQPAPVLASARPVNEPLTSSLEDLRRLDAQFADLAQYVGPAVVHIRVEGRPQSVGFR
ncbi:MAG: hypothetical protein C4320_06395 [Armatimonadota bacterium]